VNSREEVVTGIFLVLADSLLLKRVGPCLATQDGILLAS
jgi:hypothetical protein